MEPMKQMRKRTATLTMETIFQRSAYLEAFWASGRLLALYRELT